ncbi:collagen binding domain-containing protein [Nocardia sp. MDA0666]|uniref:MSCRAMM family protein n=1 Tax=Nocardia sp. MDA0666 TaxID=2135448 RepID=UPI001E55B534|nr:carboxypeptidase-like regulatory domain-containing protein [Nocardia sp. MDA0666]
MPAAAPPARSERSISGHVLRTDGHPLDGVVLTLIDQQGHQVSRATGDPRGGYVIDPPAPGSYVLIVSARGQQPTAVTVAVDGRPQRLDVTLHGSGELSGFVRAAGRAVPDATVTLTDLRGQVVGAAVTDADGGYLCSGVVGGTYTLVAVAAQLRPAAMTLTVPDSGVLHHDVELFPLAVLTGSVRAGDRAVPDALVTVLDETGAVLGTARTDGEGRYSVTDLTEGIHTVVVRGYPPREARVEVAGGAVEHDVRLSYDLPAGSEAAEPDTSEPAFDRD